MTEPHLRASDADREQVATALERHVAAGRLTLDEYAQRVSAVFAAATHGELAALTRDLPREETARPQHRQLVLAFLLAGLTLVFLAVVFALARH